MLAIAVGANSPYHNPGEKTMSKICAEQTAGSSFKNAQGERTPLEKSQEPHLLKNCRRPRFRLIQRKPPKQIRPRLAPHICYIQDEYNLMKISGIVYMLITNTFIL
jgi:hypothetical protein